MIIQSGIRLNESQAWRDLILAIIKNQGRELRTVKRKNEKSWDSEKGGTVGKGERGEGKGNVVVSLRDVNEPVNMLTTTSEQFEGGSYIRPCIRLDRLLCRLHVSPPSPPEPVLFFTSLPNPSDEMIIIVRNRRAAHFRACGSRRIIFHPLK